MDNLYSRCVAKLEAIQQTSKKNFGIFIKEEFFVILFQ